MLLLKREEQPQFSVIIATFSRPTQLQIALKAISLLEYSRSQFEVIVVDDGSPAPLDAVVAPFAERFPVLLMRQPNAGCGPARNAGACLARGRYVAFTDDDCTHNPDWLTRLESYFEQYPDAMVGGLPVNTLRSNPYSAATQLLIDYLLLTANRERTAAEFLNNMAMPREEFTGMGGFDAEFSMSAEDRDLCDRWVQSGKRIVFAPEIVIPHAHPLAWRSYWRQHFGYGRGAFHRRRKGIGRVQPAAFYARLVLFPFMRERWAPAVRSSFLLAIAQVATVAGLVREWRECR